MVNCGVVELTLLFLDEFQLTFSLICGIISKSRYYRRMESYYEKACCTDQCGFWGL